MLDDEPTGGTAAGTPETAAAAAATTSRRRRAASRPAGPPQDGPADAAAGTAQAPAAGKAAKPAKGASKAAKTADRAPAKAPARSRTRKAAAAPAETATGETAVGETAQAPSAEPAQAPRRRTRKTAAAEAQPAADAGVAPAGPAFVPPTVVFQPPAAEAAPGAGPQPGPEGEEAAEDEAGRRRRRRGGRGRRGRGKAEGGAEPETVPPTDESAAEEAAAPSEDEEEAAAPGTRRRRRRRRRGGSDDGEAEPGGDDPERTVVHVREPRKKAAKRSEDEISALKGSTRLEAKKQRRREGREQGRRRPPVLTEAEFLARRESVDRVMVVRQAGDRTQIAVLEDDVLVEHYVARASATTLAGNVYLGKVQNVLPSMEAAFVDIGKGRNAVLYAGEVNWDAAGLDGQPRRIEHALKSGDSVLVQVTKDPIGHKGARLTSQVSLPGRYLVYVPDGSMTGISRKLPDTERDRLKGILKRIVPDDAGVIVRTAAEGASEDELARDVSRLSAQWADISSKADTASPPQLLYAEPDLTIRVVRDVFNEDFSKLVVSGDDAWDVVEAYVGHVAPDLAERLSKWVDADDVFAAYRVDEQLAKALDRKVWLPSGGYLIIDPTEAMTVVDVNTGKFTGSGGNLEETVTKNNIEAAEEIVRQLRLRDVGGIIVIDFIDMVLESNRELVLRRLLECLGRDRTKHQVAEVTSLGLVQMTRKRVGQGLLEAFSTPCESCNGRGRHVHTEPVEPKRAAAAARGGESRAGEPSRRRRSAESSSSRKASAKAAADAVALVAAASGSDGEAPSDTGTAPDTMPVAEGDVVPTPQSTPDLV